MVVLPGRRQSAEEASIRGIVGSEIQSRPALEDRWVSSERDQQSANAGAGLTGFAVLLEWTSTEVHAFPVVYIHHLVCFQVSLYLTVIVIGRIWGVQLPEAMSSQAANLRTKNDPLVSPPSIRISSGSRIEVC